MATNARLRADLMKQLGGISSQRLSERVAVVRKAHGPMSVEEATYVLAHQSGLDLLKYLDRDTVDRVRGMLQLSASRGAPPPPPPTDRPVRTRASSRPVMLDSDGPVMDPLLPPSVADDAKRMAGVYRRLYVLENSARNVITRVMVAKHGKGWWSSKAPTHVRREVQKRKDREAKNPWAGKRGPAEINYADYAHLADIITNNWDDFSDIFPEQAWVKSRLGGLEPARNVTAHNNRVVDNEELRVRLHQEDWVKQIEGRRDFIPEP